MWLLPLVSKQGFDDLRGALVQVKISWFGFGFF